MNPTTIQSSTQSESKVSDIIEPYVKRINESKLPIGNKKYVIDIVKSYWKEYCESKISIETLTQRIENIVSNYCE